MLFTVCRQGCHRRSRVDPGRHREGGAQRTAGAEQPAGEQRDAAG